MTRVFEKHLKAQAVRHPGMTPQDAIKLCFQAAFGVEHLLSDKSKAMEYLQEEYSQTPAQDIEVFEPISEDYVRCNLAAWKHRGLPVEWLFEMFCQSAEKNAETEVRAVVQADAEAQERAEVIAGTQREHSEALFMEYLDSVGICIAEGGLPFDSATWLSAKEQYLSLGGKPQPVHHSKEYRDQERPAYRVIKKEYLVILPILEKASAMLVTAHAAAAARDEGNDDNDDGGVKPPKIIVIDGRAAAGKTTMAAILSAVLKADVIHMDDFFLPPELRTAERLAENGGNVHYERFCLEVLPFLKQSAKFSYRSFDCRVMDFCESRLVQSQTWRIVEGSYSSHPIFGSYADLCVFCDIAPEEQMQRIVKRNGEAMVRVFAEKWIPMEEQYFAAELIKEKADVVI